MLRDPLKKFLIEALPKMEWMGGTGANPSFPNFDLMPFDYLEFAESELTKSDAASRINCVAHLKRAIDCELDTFFSVLGLYALIQKRNLRFEKKTELIRAMGLVSPRSLAKLNSIRNKLEHEYALPDLQDLELYFDLCSAFVSLIDGYIFMYCSHAEMEWGDFEKAAPSMRVEYHSATMALKFETEIEGKGEAFEFTPQDIGDFAWAMKVFFWLCRGVALISTERIVEDLGKEKEPNKAVEPTPVAVTPPASAGAAPSTSAAHLER